MTISKAVIEKLTRRVTQKHARQIKAEERNARARWSREYVYSDRVNFTDVAARILPEAYKLASGNGSLPASKRQIYYAAREAFREATGREITQQRCNTLLLQYVNTHPTQTSSWRVTADPRGTLFIPNTSRETRIPCGTLDIDAHLDTMADELPLDEPLAVPVQWPTLAAGQRFRAVLYIEKEGFEPLLRQTRIAERFEIAVLSCKGQSVVAARKYVDHVCKVNGGVPLFVVHDFDVFGFFIAARLTSVSAEAYLDDRVAYQFANDIDVTDFGLRLADAQAYGLASERCKRPKSIHGELGCTDDEVAFLLSGRRIELNAFTAPQFVEWLEGKLRAAGLDDRQRMVPADDVLERAYRRSMVAVRVNDAVRKMHNKAVAEAREITTPKRLSTRIRTALAACDEPWDIALHKIVADDLGVELPGDDIAGEGSSAQGLGLNADDLRMSREFAKYDDAEFARAMEEVQAKSNELTKDDVLKRLRRNRRNGKRSK